MKMIWQDIKYGVRLLAKSPGFTAIAVLSLALGIGANTAVFSVEDGLFLRSLPYPHQSRLALLWLRSPGIGILQDWPSQGQYNDLKTQTHVFDEMAIAVGKNMTLTGQRQPERIGTISATSTLLDLLGAKPLLGRTFLSEEDSPGRPKTAVLSYGLWQGLFGGDPQILNRNVILDGQQYAVVGVLRPDFELNDEIIPTVEGIQQADVFLPLPQDAKTEHNYGSESYNILARLKPGVSMRAAQADVSVIANRIRERDERDRSFTISVVPLQEQVVGGVRAAVLVLLGAVALVLLIACVNVANLLLARTAGRQKEIAIRAALGASRRRLTLQMLVESLLLGLLGGTAGLFIAAAALWAVRTINPGNIPLVGEIGLKGTVLLFTFGISIMTALGFGMIPALRAFRTNLNSMLKAGGRTSQISGGLSLRRDKLRWLFVAMEFALSLVLLAGAGLLIRSFARLLSVPPGFNPDHVISMRVSLSGPKYKDLKERALFYEALGERIKNLPGVTGEGAVSVLPLASAVSWGGLTVEGYVPPANQPELQMDQRVATPDYFPTMQIPLLKGRFFTSGDGPDSQPVVLVDEKMAEFFWPHGNPIGKRVMRGDNGKCPCFTIVGVVGVVKQYGLDADTRMVVYYPQKHPHKQDAEESMYLVARTATNPGSLSASMIQAVHSLDGNVPVHDVSTMAERLHRSLARQRFSMAMLGAFAGFALLLTAVGIYGVMSYVVSQGTRDIAIRMALGAQQRSVLALVVSQGMKLTLFGVVAGSALAIGGTRLMASLLYGVSAYDPLTFFSVTFLLVVVSLAACWIPARRAMRVEPMEALRYE